MRSQITATGWYVPEKILTNDDLAKKIETSDEWILKRTGIRERRIAGADETTADLGIKAAKNLTERCGKNIEDVDLVLVATSSPERTFPATATKIQHGLGINQGAAFDVQAVCAGFVFALATADSLIKTGLAKKVLVIGTELYSRLMDWEDRTTCILFSDGAGAVLLEKSDGEERGILQSFIRSDGKFHDKLCMTGGPGSTATVGKIIMDGREVFREAIDKMAEALEVVCRRENIAPNALDWVIAHQANARIIDAMGEKMKLEPEKLVKTVSRFANNSAATIPIALAVTDEQNKLKAGQLIGLTALGAGFSWGSILLRW